MGFLARAGGELSESRVRFAIDPLPRRGVAVRVAVHRDASRRSAAGVPQECFSTARF